MPESEKQDGTIPDPAPENVAAGPQADDLKQRALAMGLELSKRAIESESLDELFYILTNDIRLLVEFDRAMLVTHFAEVSRFSAATNQPTIQDKSEFAQVLTQLAQDLGPVDRGIWIAAEGDTAKLSEQNLPPGTAEHLQAFLRLTGSAFLLCVPLQHFGKICGHLLLEFHERNLPNQVQILTLVSLAPFLATALAEKWLLAEHPSIRSLFEPKAPVEKVWGIVPRKPAYAVLAAFVVLLGLLVVRVDRTVGGEAEIVPREKHMAFVKIEGLIAQIHVSEGSIVRKDDVLATLDAKEVEHEIATVERRLEILTREMDLLRREAGPDPSKLAESQLVRLKRLAAQEELDYLKWKTQFLTIRAPVAGLVTTKEVETFVGKKFRAGEPFCEIAVPGELWAAVQVPEDRISLVQKGQTGAVYLDSEPDKAHVLTVTEISPIALAQPRLGNVFAVKGSFVRPPNYLRVGMKGVGKIDTGRTSIAGLVNRRVALRWNQWSLHW